MPERTDAADYGPTECAIEVLEGQTEIEEEDLKS
jgi:hypothetical protein